MIIADFSSTDSILIYAKEPLYQYNTGQHLNIIGLDLDYFYNVKLVTSESITLIEDAEEITDGFRIAIPDSILAESGHYKDYWVMAYINLTNGDDTITTTRIVNILVKFISEEETAVSSTDSDTVSLYVDDDGNVTIS